MDSAVKNMHKTAAEQTQRCQNHFKREYQTVGKAFNQLGLALQQDGNYCKYLGSTFSLSLLQLNVESRDLSQSVKKNTEVTR